MRIIKLGLISAVVFFLLITAFSLMIPSRARISRAIDIATSRDSLFQQIGRGENWAKWYPGADSGCVSVSGHTKGVNCDESEALTIRIMDDSTITVNKLSNNKAVSAWNIMNSAVPGVVTVQWYMDFKLRWYPWEKFSGLLLEKRYGPVMERGLARLKLILEK